MNQRTHVIAMGSRKIHLTTCRFVDQPGSPQFPFADGVAMRLLPGCQHCCKGN